MKNLSLYENVIIPWFVFYEKDNEFEQHYFQFQIHPRFTCYKSEFIEAVNLSIKNTRGLPRIVPEGPVRRIGLRSDDMYNIYQNAPILIKTRPYTSLEQWVRMLESKKNLSAHSLKVYHAVKKELLHRDLTGIEPLNAYIFLVGSYSKSLCDYIFENGIKSAKFRGFKVEWEPMV